MWKSKRLLSETAICSFGFLRFKAQDGIQPEVYDKTSLKQFGLKCKYRYYRCGAIKVAPWEIKRGDGTRLPVYYQY